VPSDKLPERLKSPKNGSDLELGVIINKVEKLNHKYICFTGGEPLLYKSSIIPLLQILHKKGYYISVETNGTIDISPFFRYVESFVIDLKTGIPNYNMLVNNYTNLRKTDVIKFVVGSKKDLQNMINNYSFLQHHYIDKTQKPIIAFSPIISKTFTPKILFNTLLEHKIYNSLISLQMHKFIGFQ